MIARFPSVLLRTDPRPSNRSQKSNDYIGFLTFKSPDKLAPATMPVTAVKKTPNVTKKSGSFCRLLSIQFGAKLFLVVSRLHPVNP